MEFVGGFYCEETMIYATKARKGVKEMLQQMEMRNVELTREDCEEYEGLVDAVDSRDVVLHLPESFKGFTEESTVIYCYFVTETEKVEIAEKEKIAECFSHLKENIVRHCQRRPRFEGIDVTFVSRE